MKLLLILAVEIFIVALFLYSKLMPYKDRLDEKNLKTYNFFEKIFKPILDVLKRITRPYQVGQGLSIDVSSIVLLFILLVLLTLLA